MRNLLSMLVLGVLALAAVAPAQLTPEADRAQQVKLEREYKASKARFEKKPTAANKKAHVEATVRFGTATMMTGTLPPAKKYPSALKLYNEALKLDPNNKEAKNNRDMIIGIYKSMGRPVPKV